MIRRRNNPPTAAQRTDPVAANLSFNSAKKSFKGKTGENVKMGKFNVEKKNTVRLEVSTDPVTANATLKFEVTCEGCLGKVEEET